MSSRRVAAMVMFLVAIGLVLDGGLMTALITADTYDFDAYYLAGQAVLRGYSPYDNRQVYRTADELGLARMRFVYAPLVAPLFAPVALLPYGVASRLAVLMQLGGLVVLALLLAPYLLRGLEGDDRSLWAGMGALLLAAYHPAGYVLRVGQISLVIACLLLWSLSLAQRGQDRAAGVVLAVGVAVKPECAPLLLYFLLKRRWAAAGWTLLVLALIVALGLLVMGVDVHRAYLNQLLQFWQTPKFAAGYQNLPAFWARLLAWPGHSPLRGFEHLLEPLSTVGAVLLLAPAVTVALLRRWEQLSENERLGELSLLLLATVLATRAAGLHTLVYALPGLVVVLVALRELPLRWGCLVAWGAAYCLLALQFQYRAPALEHGARVVLISSKLAGGLVLWGMLLAHNLRRPAQVVQAVGDNG